MPSDPYLPLATRAPGGVFMREGSRMKFVILGSVFAGMLMAASLAYTADTARAAIVQQHEN